MKVQCNAASKMMSCYCQELCILCNEDDFHRIRHRIRELTSRLFTHLVSIKGRKLQALQNTPQDDSLPMTQENPMCKPVVTIPAEMELTYKISSQQRPLLCTC